MKVDSLAGCLAAQLALKRAVMMVGWLAFALAECWAVLRAERLAGTKAVSLVDM